MPIQVLLPDRLELCGRVRKRYLVAQVVDPSRAGVVVGDVDLAVQLCVAQAVGTGDIRQVPDLRARGGESEFDEIAENVLFGEILGAHGDSHTFEFRDGADTARPHRQRYGPAGFQTTRREQCRRQGGRHCRDMPWIVSRPHRNPRGPRNCSASAPSQSTSRASATARIAPTHRVTVSRSL